MIAHHPNCQADASGRGCRCGANETNRSFRNDQIPSLPSLRPSLNQIAMSKQTVLGLILCDQGQWDSSPYVTRIFDALMAGDPAAFSEAITIGRRAIAEQEGRS